MAEDHDLGAGAAVLGLAETSPGRGQTLTEILQDELEQVRREFKQTGQPFRVFKDFRYQTLHSWSRERRVDRQG